MLTLQSVLLTVPKVKMNIQRCDVVYTNSGVY